MFSIYTISSLSVLHEARVQLSSEETTVSGGQFVASSLIGPSSCADRSVTATLSFSSARNSGLVAPLHAPSTLPFDSCGARQAYNVMKIETHAVPFAILNIVWMELMRRSSKLAERM